MAQHKTPQGSKTEEVTVDTLLSNRWWTFSVRALAVALFGIAVLARENRPLVEFSRWFGIAAVVSGLLTLCATVVRFDAGNPWDDPNWDGIPTFTLDLSWRPLTVQGALSFVTGAVVLVTPITSARPLFAIIAGLALTTALCQVLTAGQLQRLATGWQAMTLAAVISFCSGLTLAASSGAAATTRMTIVAGSALIEAAALVVVAVLLERSLRVAPAPLVVQVHAVELLPGRTARP
jgi:uncharacterized membrane protein HdeD (DUF308 family)